MRSRRKGGPFVGDTGETLRVYEPGASECCEGDEWMRWELNPYPAGENGRDTVWLWAAEVGSTFEHRDSPPGDIEPATEVR